MKYILTKLINDENHFNCTFNNQERTCKILKLDLETSKAFVRFDTPVKKIIRQEVISNNFADSDYNSFEDVEIKSLEEWISL